MRPDPKSMSTEHLLDEFLKVYRDGGQRRAKIREEILRRCSTERWVIYDESPVATLRYRDKNGWHRHLGEVRNPWSLREEVEGIMKTLDQLPYHASLLVVQLPE